MEIEAAQGVDFLQVQKRFSDLSLLVDKSLSELLKGIAGGNDKNGKKIQIHANVIFSLSSRISVISLFFLSQILISLDPLKKTILR